MIDTLEVDRRVGLIRERCAILESLARLDLHQFARDPSQTAAAERHLHLACEGCLELGMVLVQGLKLRSPTSFEDLGDILIAAGLTSPDGGNQIARIARLRTLLVHDFVSLDPQVLHEQLPPSLLDIEYFAKQAIVFTRRMA
jgi:uncharacterized protein YutE (UPF0331/DUF86 family)